MFNSFRRFALIQRDEVIDGVAARFSWYLDNVSADVAAEALTPEGERRMKRGAVARYLTTRETRKPSSSDDFTRAEAKLVKPYAGWAEARGSVTFAESGLGRISDLMEVTSSGEVIYVESKVVGTLGLSRMVLRPTSRLHGAFG